MPVTDQKVRRSDDQKMEMPAIRSIPVVIAAKSYQALLYAEPEGGFTVTVLELPGCITYGENIDQALALAKEAIELYVEVRDAER
jgi:predicted RNase H-like HicB family nuclease